MIGQAKDLWGLAHSAFFGSDILEVSYSYEPSNSSNFIEKAWISHEKIKVFQYERVYDVN